MLLQVGGPLKAQRCQPFRQLRPTPLSLPSTLKGLLSVEFEALQGFHFLYGLAEPLPHLRLSTVFSVEFLQPRQALLCLFKLLGSVVDLPQGEGETGGGVLELMAEGGQLLPQLLPLLLEGGQVGQILLNRPEKFQKTRLSLLDEVQRLLKVSHDGFRVLKDLLLLLEDPVVLLPEVQSLEFGDYVAEILLPTPPLFFPLLNPLQGRLGLPHRTARPVEIRQKGEVLLGEVQQLPLGDSAGQVSLIVLPVEGVEVGRQLPEEGELEGLVVDKDPLPLVFVKLAAEDDLPTVLLIFEKFHERRKGAVKPEVPLNGHPVFAGADQGLVETLPSEEAETVHENRFSSAGLSGQYVETGLEINLQILNDCKVPDSELLKHVFYSTLIGAT